MVLSRSMYEPLVTPDMFGSLLPQPEYTGGPEYVGGLPPMGVLPPAAQPFQQVQAPMPAPAPMPAAAPMPAPAEDYEYLNPFDGDAYEYNAPSARDYDPFAEFREKYGTAPPVAGAAPSYIEGGALLFRNRNGAISGFAAPIEGATYALVDNKTGNVISSGTGQAGLEQVWQASQDRSATMGKNANWSVVGVDPTSGNPFNVASDTPPRSFLGTLADFALPAAGAALLPMALGPGAVVTGLGAAGGSAASSIAQGRGLGDTLKRAGITGVTAGGLAAASGTPLLGATPPPTPVASTVSSGLSKVASSLGSAAGSSAGNAAGIVVTGAKSALAPAVASGLSGVGGSTLSNLASMPAGRGADQVFEQPTTPAVSPPQGALPGNEIVVPGTLPTPAAPTPPLAPAVASGLSGLASSLGNAAANVAPTPSSRPPVEITPEGDLVLTGTPTPPTTPAVNPGWVLDNGFWRSTSAPSPFAPAPTPSQQPAPFRDPETGDLVLTGTPTAPGGVLPGAVAGAGVMADTALQMANLAPVSDNVIEVIREKNARGDALTDGERSILAVAGAGLGGGLIFGPDGGLQEIISEGTPRQEPEPTTPVVPPVSPAAPTTPKDIQDAFDEEFGDPEAKKNSLLDEIIKYYTLGAGALDLLGGALGGRGGSGAGTPYNSQLGPMPTFGRSAFTPFTGDYETYGFGPEWNFFGGTPPPTPSGPPAGILPPAANPNFRLV